MGAKNKKNKKPNNSSENKQNHAFDGGDDKKLNIEQVVEEVPKKKIKKKPQNGSELKDPAGDPVDNKKSKKRKADGAEEVPDSPSNVTKKKKKSKATDSPIEQPATSPDKPKKKKNKKVTSETPKEEDESITGSPDKPKKKKKSKIPQDTANEDPTTPDKPKKKKKSNEDPANDSKAVQPDSDVEETQNSDTEEKKLAYNHADEKRTVFCGNIPNETGVNKTTVKNLFAQYGKIKTIRMRSENGNILFAKKNKKSCTSFNAYIVFESIEEARKSLQLNGYKLKENHLRVNMANDKNKAFQSKGSIFVGNLPFDATEKEVHELFESCGKINYVRIIPRKGICYVCFDKGGTAMLNALKLNDTEFKGRNIRVTRCETKQKQEKKKLYKRDPKTGRKIKLRVKKSHKLNDELVRGRGKKSINNPIIKKIKDSQKAKFNRFTDNEQVSKKDLFRRGGKFDKDNREENRNRMKQKKSFFGSKVEGSDFSAKKKGVKKGKITKVAKEQKVIAKKLKSAAMRMK